MRKMKHVVNIPAALMAVALGIVIGYQAIGQRAVQPDATIVASVRIEKLFDDLQQRAEAKIEVAMMEQEITAEKRRREEELNTLHARLEDTVAAATRAQLTDEIGLKRLQLKFWFQTAVEELELEKALQMQNLYSTIREAIEALAKAEGYDIVIVNDSSRDLPFDRESRVPAQIQILQQIGARKILYLNPAIEITDDLIRRMNNAFRGP